jgi:hypothetical protein
MTTDNASSTTDESTKTTAEETGTTADVTGTTESGETSGKQPVQRSVHELLKLSTFQGMTDAEIQSLIDYYVEVAHNDEHTKVVQATEIQTMNAQCAAYDSLRDDANSVLKQVLSAPLNLARIDESGNEV